MNNQESYYVLCSQGWKYIQDGFFAIGETKEEAKTNWSNKRKRKPITVSRTTRLK